MNAQYAPVPTLEIDRIEVIPTGDGQVSVIYLPEYYSIDSKKEVTAKAFTLDYANRRIHLHPFKTSPPWGPKQVPITLDGFEIPEVIDEEDAFKLLDVLPDGFVKRYKFGLGIKMKYRPILSVIEDISHLCISKNAPTQLNCPPGTLQIALSDYNQYIKLVNTITNRAYAASSSVMGTGVHDFLAPLVGLDEAPGRQHRNPMIKRMVALASGKDYLSVEEQHETLKVLRANTGLLARSQPQKVAKLKSDLELVTLKNLIAIFEKMMHSARSTEEEWQRLLSENPFILQMAFGSPITIVHDKPTVGGIQFSGKGAKFTDFLVQNRISNNVAIVEIKTPATELLNKKPYRPNLYGPSKDLTSAVNQTLDQQYHLRSNWQSLIAKEKLEAEAYSIHGCLIIGEMPTDGEKTKSFELYRSNSKDVTIITFDELLEKLRGLHALLSDREADDSSNHEEGAP